MNPSPPENHFRAAAQQFVAASSALVTAAEQVGMRVDQISNHPVHPSPFIKAEIIEGYNLSVSGAAKILKVSRPSLSTLLNGHASLSGDMALRIEQAFGVDMETLMGMQSSYDIAQARKRKGAIQVERYQPEVHP